MVLSALVRAHPSESGSNPLFIEKERDDRRLTQSPTVRWGVSLGQNSGVLVFGRALAAGIGRRQTLAPFLFSLCHCRHTWSQMWTPGWVVGWGMRGRSTGPGQQSRAGWDGWTGELSVVCVWLLGF